MELRAGFKRTEVGTIPDQWNCLPLGNVIAPGTSITYGIVQAGPHVHDGIPYIKTGDMSASRLPIEDLARTSKKIASRYPRSTVRAGELVYSIRASVGAVHCVPPELDGANLTQGTARISPSTSVDTEYLLNALRSTACQNWITLHTKGTTYQEITLETLRALPVPLPSSKAEQEAIAQALSDVDALVESLEQFLTKKRQLKQGAMQELLTPPVAGQAGKKRLPGVSGEREVKPLSDLFDFSGGFTASRDQLSLEGYCYLHYGDIHTSKKSFVDVRSEYQDIPKLDIPLKKVSSVSLLDDGDVVFVDASEDDEGTSKHVVTINPDAIPFISGLHTIVAKSKTDALDHQYRRYCFQTPAVKTQFRFFAVGTKVSGISKTNIAKVTLPVPSVPEQSAIAAILSDMDAEIAALESKLAKAHGVEISSSSPQT